MLEPFFNIILHKLIFCQILKFYQKKIFLFLNPLFRSKFCFTCENKESFIVSENLFVGEL